MEGDKDGIQICHSQIENLVYCNTVQCSIQHCKDEAERTKRQKRNEKRHKRDEKGFN